VHAEVIVNFLSFFLSRLVKALVVVIGVVVINFFLIRMAPGDPATVMAGEAGAGDATYVTQLREQFGLDQPVLTQLGIYLKGWRSSTSATRIATTCRCWT
jgi:peptide/nickel transport system permease protein